VTREDIRTELEESWETVFDSILFEEFMLRLQNRCGRPLTEYNEFELASDFEFVLGVMKDDSEVNKYDIF
jgi:hypothetical protein